jgi:hypothetical protein
MTQPDTDRLTGQRAPTQFTIRCLAAGVRREEPLTVGLPMPQGLLGAGRTLIVHHASRTARTQLRVLDRWPDGSARWVLADWLADEGHATVEVVEDHAAVPPAAGPALAVRRDAAGVTVETGSVRFVIAAGSPFPLQGELDGRPVLDAGKSRLVLEDGHGTVYGPRTTRIDVLDEGPVRACLLLYGTMVSPNFPSAAEFEWELHFFAGLPVVRTRLTFRNPRPSAHPGGMWDLGAAGSIYLRDLSLRLALLESMFPAKVFCSPEIGQPLRPVAVPLELYQDSSGGENWQSHCHVNREGRVPLQFRGYRLRQGGEETAGLRATPVVQLKAGAVELSCTMEHFWQNFPKAVEADGKSLTLRLWPRQHADLHELQGGEQKTHELALSFGSDTVSETPLEWARDPMHCMPDPAWVCSTGAIPYLTPRSEDPNTHYLALVDQTLEGDDTFIHKRERVDEYGWRHFGDIYADHEAVYHEGPGELVSHYNNQYDGVWGMGVQFLRSGDVRWLQQMRELAQHVIDIDIYHTDGDKSAYNHGMFWHTCHYVDAGRSTHRSYSADAKVNGGGPSSGHLYTRGLGLYYLLTGDQRARRAVLELGEYVISCDDGARTLFRWLSRRPTGHATHSAPGYHGAGRASGNALHALLDAHERSDDPRFLDKAEDLIHRTIHPEDDPDGLALSDPESRWFYTMFLDALARYLDRKVELRQIDTMYAYGRACLVSYSRWMCRRERPTLEQRERLHYPTETWPAQDIRKSQVLYLASRYAPEPERKAILDKASWFHEESLRQLQEFPTRSLARPATILLSHGWVRAWFQRSQSAAIPPTGPGFDAGPRVRFIPQREAAVRLAKIILAVGATVLLAAVIIRSVFWR